MLNLATIFSVVLVSLVTTHGYLIPKKDFENILQLLKEQNNNDVTQIMESSNSDSSSDEDSSNNSINGLLKTMEVIDLIKKANQNKDFKRRESKNVKRIGKQLHKRTKYTNYRAYEDNKQRDSDTQKQLEQLLEESALKRQKHKRLTPNSLLGSNGLEDYDQRDQTNDGLNKYSKIFVILDPKAIKTSKNQEVLSNLVTRILSLSSSTEKKARRPRNMSHRYKGFNVNNNLLSRRYRQNSKESYGGGSGEDDYKPKRLRNERGSGGNGGGGGGSGGRTAIPYIRQRGDIYEREH